MMLLLVQIKSLIESGEVLMVFLQSELNVTSIHYIHLLHCIVVSVLMKR